MGDSEGLFLLVLTFQKVSGEALRFVEKPAFSVFSHYHAPRARKKHIDGCPCQQPACPKHFGAGVVPEGVLGSPEAKIAKIMVRRY